MTTLVSERSPITTPKLRDRVAAPRATPRAPASPQAAPRASLVFRFIATLLEWHHRRVVRRQLVLRRAPRHARRQGRRGPGRRHGQGPDLQPPSRQW